MPFTVELGPEVAPAAELVPGLESPNPVPKRQLASPLNAKARD